jgi:hypothetical protein
MIAWAASAMIAVVGLTGCSVAPQPEPSSPSVPPQTASPSTSPTPTGPVLVPDGSAQDNLPLFTAVMEDVWDSDDSVKGRAYVDALTDAGFDKADMQVTRDKTSVGNAADAIQFSVLWGDECLVGQVGPSTKVPTAVVLPELPSGGCLIGQTRPIDW